MSKLVDLIANAICAVQPLKHLQRPRAYATVKNEMIFDVEPDSPKKCERLIADITKAQRVVLTSSGTAALHLALLAAGVRRDDEVLMPSLTFAATANAAIYIGAHPHFVDVSTEALAINPYKLQTYLQQVASNIGAGTTVNRATGRRIAAIVPVHLLGMPCDVGRIDDIVAPYGIAVVEDATEAFGTRIGPQHAGTLGEIGALSFNSNKIVTMGGGGAVLCRRDHDAEYVSHLANQAKLTNSLGWEHDAVGFNYRPNTLGCALAVSQLWRFDETLAAKKDLHRRYAEALAPFRDAAFLYGHPGSNCWLNGVAMRNDPDDAPALVNEMRRRGYECRMLFRPLHLQAPWAPYQRADLRVTEDMGRRVVCLPSSI